MLGRGDVACLRLERRAILTPQRTRNCGSKGQAEAAPKAEGSPGGLRKGWGLGVPTPFPVGSPELPQSQRGPERKEARR